MARKKGRSAQQQDRYLLFTILYYGCILGMVWIGFGILYALYINVIAFGIGFGAGIMAFSIVFNVIIFIFLLFLSRIFKRERDRLR